MKVKYVGTEPTLTIGELVFRRGKTVDVAEDVGRDLLHNYPFVKATEPARKGRGSAAGSKPGVETR